PYPRRFRETEAAYPALTSPLPRVKFPFLRSWSSVANAIPVELDPADVVSGPGREALCDGTMTSAGTSRPRGARAEPAAGQSGRRVRAAVVIPARLASQRFPRKVLARETGKYLIQHVWEGVQGTRGVARVIIATDSEEVHRAAASFGAEVRLT